MFINTQTICQMNTMVQLSTPYADPECHNVHSFIHSF